MKLFKAISSSGVLSRRKSMDAVKEAMVTVNGKLILDPSFEIQANDDIRLDNQKIKLNSDLTTILLNKPKGYLSTKSDEKNRKTIFELIPNKPPLNHIGRLDMDTTGAILLTNDGNLAQFLMHPKNKIEKEYVATSDQYINDKTINKVRKGIFIGSGQKGKAKIVSQEKMKGKVEIRLILKQGKKNEIRRIFKFLDLNLFSLKRLRIGEINLGSLPVGSWRLLSKKELKYLSNLQSK
jgi:pseudouridine synthase|tara:strand:- start:3594 stop:4304 length:711 start_codon:yes stop_codon:yes gene_type:complete